MPPVIDIPSILIIFVAYLIRGITGFGSGLIAVPLLAHLLPLQVVVPMILVLDLTAALILGGQSRTRVRWNEIGPLVPASLIGILVGANVLARAPTVPLLVTLGLLVLIFGVRYLLTLPDERPVSRLWALPAGFVGGLVGALFGTGGPPYVLYLTHRLRDKGQLRATLSGLFMLDGGLRLLTFTGTGMMLQPDLWRRLLPALPVLAFGLYIGHRVHLRIRREQLIRLVGLLLVLSGGSLLLKAAR